MKINKLLLTCFVLAAVGCGKAPTPPGPAMSKDEMKSMATTHAAPKVSAAETKKNQQARQHAAHGGR